MKPQVNRVARDLAVEQSLDAALEIDEVIRHKRQDSPAFTKLIASLVGSPTRELNSVKKDLLSDSRLTSLYFRAASSPGKLNASVEDLDRVLGLLLSADTTNLTKLSKDDLSSVRDFCLALNQELVAEAFGRSPQPPFARLRQNKLASGYGS
jgi:hypothetical protein